MATTNALKGVYAFKAFSAGSQPKRQIHPYTLDLLRRLNYEVRGLCSKNWKEPST
jgi:arsenate reductase